MKKSIFVGEKKKRNELSILQHFSFLSPFKHKFSPRKDDKVFNIIRAKIVYSVCEKKMIIEKLENCVSRIETHGTLFILKQRLPPRCQYYKRESREIMYSKSRECQCETLGINKK